MRVKTIFALTGVRWYEYYAAPDLSARDGGSFMQRPMTVPLRILRAANSLSGRRACNRGHFPCLSGRLGWVRLSGWIWPFLIDGDDQRINQFFND